MMQCRANCGACCIQPKISQAYFGAPKGKPAGQACVHLSKTDFRCAIWGTEHYPDFCRNFLAEPNTCGETREQAIEILGLLDRETSSY